LLPGPTVPSRPIRRSGAWRWAVSRGGNLDRNPGPTTSRSPSWPKPFRFPRWLPVRAEALAVRRSADLELAFRFLAVPVFMDRSPRNRVRQDPRPKPWFRLGMAMSRSPGSTPGSQLPSRSPVLPDRFRNRSTFRAGGNALARGHRFLPGWSSIRRSGVPPVRSASPKAFGPGPVPAQPEGPLGSDGFPFRPRAFRDPGGRWPKPAALAFAEGQARPRPLRGGFVSRPAVRFRLTCLPGGDQPGFHLGCGWEGFPPFPEDRLGHIRKLSRFLSRTKRIPPVDNEDNVHNLRSGTGAIWGVRRGRACGSPSSNAPLAPRAMPA
jgi:hypothetical protein